MGDWVRTGGTISDEELAGRWSEVELRSEPDEDAWDEDVAGLRAYETVAYLDDEEVARSPAYMAYYNPESVPGSQTSPQTQADLDETALRRADATGKPVTVAGFSESGKGKISDVEKRDGRFELVDVGTVPITASPPPKILGRLRPLAARRTPRVVARPRERRARSASAGGSRASPSSDGELDPPPAATGWWRRLRRLLGGRA